MASVSRLAFCTDNLRTPPAPQRNGIWNGREMAAYPLEAATIPPVHQTWKKGTHLFIGQTDRSWPTAA